MKCKNCGAEVDSSLKNCPFCDSEIEKEKENVVNNITNNYYSKPEEKTQTNTVCPKCKSNSVKFKREEAGSVKNKSTKQVIHRTVAICQDCGYTWVPNAETVKKKHGAWWWVLAVLFFPISLSIWFYKTEKIKLEKKYRIIILAVIWVVLLAIGAASPDTETPALTANENTSISETDEKEDDNSKNTSSKVIEINNVDLGAYGKYKTLNEGKGEDEYKFIEYHIPAGKYKINNKSTHAVQVTVYSDDYTINSSGWEEAKESFDYAVIMENESKEVSVGSNQHIKLSDGEAELYFEKID